MKPRELGYQEVESAPLRGKRSDLQRAQDDLDYVNQQESAYNEAIKDGRVTEDPLIRQEFVAARENAQQTLDRTRNGGSYREPSLMEEIRNSNLPEYAEAFSNLVRETAGIMGCETAPGEVVEAAKDLLRVVVPEAINRGPVIADNMHETYDTSSQKFMRKFNQQFPLRDQDGNPLDAAGNPPAGIPK